MIIIPDIDFLFQMTVPSNRSSNLAALQESNKRQQGNFRNMKMFNTTTLKKNAYELKKDSNQKLNHDNINKLSNIL